MGLTILFPGRHHVLTKFQHEYLSNILQRGIGGRKVSRIVFAITSSNHENTRRNPVPLYLRSIAIDTFAATLPGEVKIYPIPDVRQTSRFALYMLSQMYYQSGERLTPKNTILACSTPDVIRMFRKLGFKHVPVELTGDKKHPYITLRPYDIIQRLVQEKIGGSSWRTHVHPATLEVFDKYGLDNHVRELFHDALLNENADITDTRNYSTYAQGMDNVVGIKYADIRPFVQEGKIVDMGCGTGALIQKLAQEFQESDIIGIEGTRKLYEYCRLQEYSNPFVFFYRRNITDQHFKPNSINTYIYSSVLHEIYSYIGKRQLDQTIKDAYQQLKLGGRLIIRDVVGPEHPTKRVWIKLNHADGRQTGSVAALSTEARFYRFVEDFRPYSIQYKKRRLNGQTYIELSYRDAYEFIAKMTYTDNWKSELHETFGFYSFSQWKALLAKYGFRIIEGSRTWQSPYIIKNMYQPRAELFTHSNGTLQPLDYPPTNMILVGEKQN